MNTRPQFHLIFGLGSGQVIRRALGSIFFVRSHASLIALAILLHGGLISCTKKKGAKDLFPKKHTLWVNWGTEPPTLDWNLANDIVSGNILLNLMEPLVGLDLSSPGLEAIPGLFSSWKSNKNHTEWTFQLREGVKWSDGQPLTLQHIKNSFHRLLSPALGAEGASYLYPIKNAEAFHTGKLKDFNQVGLEILDKKTLRFTLEQSLVFFPKMLTYVNTAPIRIDLLELHKDQWTKPGKMVTLGAYILAEWKHDERIVLKANSQYFGTPPKIPIIAGRMIEDLNAAAQLFEAGKLDIQRGLTPNDEKRFENKPEFVTTPSLAVLYFNFNTRISPFQDITARRLIVHSIDRKEVVSLLGGYRHVNTGWLPRGLPGSIEDQGLAFDTTKALKLFQQLKKEQRHALQKLEIDSNSNETHKIMLENIQAQLSRNLGLEASINMLEWKTYLQKIKTQPAAIFRLGFVSMYPDPHFLMSLWKSNSHFNMTGWASKEYDQLVDLAASEADIEKRTELYQKAQKILIEEAPFFAIYSASNLSLISSRVKNYRPNPLERLKFKDLELKN